MSSHHYVKEGQEPALIIANGEECSMKLLTSIMEWCPFLVVLDGAYQRVKSLQIKPDVVIGDFDSIVIETPDPDVEYIKIEDQNSTDLEKGINYLISKNFLDINVVWVTGDRLDHTINNLGSLAKYDQANIVFYDDVSKAFLLAKTYKKHYEKGDIISLIPMGTVQGITTKNLKYPLDDEDLDLVVRSGSSNCVLESGLVTITYKIGKLLLIESTDAVK